MMIISGGEGIIWSIWYLLAWIWSWDVVKNQLFVFAFLSWRLRTNPASLHPPSIYPTNILLVHTIPLQHVHMMIIGGGEGVIWSICDVFGWIWSSGMLSKINFLHFLSGC
jgi:hypothetical protein